ncbi:hypothetical protein CVU75_03365 [Candidatus Dependentiae bacterium HGW-Dependentiae-1]|nr:MAG: hypothetical protein CVU75_03365 [Candidatus Dependentiae bacterium HGW-Dependentiae-1]
MKKSALFLITLKAPILIAMHIYPIHPGDALQAAAHGRVDRLEYIQKKAPELLKEIDANGNTALHIAILRPQHNVIEYLLKTSAFHMLLSVKNSAGRTPLHCASAHGDGLTMQHIKNLLQHTDTSPDILDNEGQTADALYAQYKKRFGSLDMSNQQEGSTMSQIVDADAPAEFNNEYQTIDTLYEQYKKQFWTPALSD